MVGENNKTLGDRYAEADAIVLLATGQDIAFHGRRLWDLVGREAMEGVIKSLGVSAKRSWPKHYTVLGISPEVSDVLVKAVYKVRAREAHPDTGGSGKAFKRVQQAYEAICKERGMQK